MTFARWLRTYQALLTASHKKGKSGHGPEKELHTPLMTSCCLSPPPSPLPPQWSAVRNEHWGVLPKQLDDSDKATFSITRVTCNNCQSPQLRFPWLLGTLWNVRQPCPIKLLLLIARNLMHNLPWTWWCKRQRLQSKVLCVFLHVECLIYVRQCSPLARCVYLVQVHSLLETTFTPHPCKKHHHHQWRCKILVL